MLVHRCIRSAREPVLWNKVAKKRIPWVSRRTESVWKTVSASGSLKGLLKSRLDVQYMHLRARAWSKVYTQSNFPDAKKPERKGSRSGMYVVTDSSSRLAHAFRTNPHILLSIQIFCTFCHLNKGEGCYLKQKHAVCIAGTRACLWCCGYRHNVVWNFECLRNKTLYMNSQ